MTIVQFVCWAVVVGLVVAWIVILSEKRGWREWLQVHADCIVFGPELDRDLFNRLFGCNYCVSWWLSVAICLILLPATGEWLILAVPFCSTIIAIKCLR